MNKQSYQHNFLDCPEAEEIVFIATNRNRDPKQGARLRELLDTTTRLRPTPDIWYLKAKLGRSNSPGGFKDLADSYKFELEFQRTCLQKALELNPSHVRSQLFLRYLDDIQNRVRPKHWYLFLFHRRGFPTNLDFSYISPRFVFQPKKSSSSIDSNLPLSVRNAFSKAFNENGAFWFRPFQNMLYVQGYKWEGICDLAEALRHYASQSKELVERYQVCLHQLDTPMICSVCQTSFLPLEKDPNSWQPDSLCWVCWEAINLKEHTEEGGSEGKNRKSRVYESILKDVDLTPPGQELMKADLRRAAELAETLPLLDEAALLKTIAPEKLDGLVRHMWHMQPKEVYAKTFGSTLKAYVEAGVIESQATIPSLYGNRCLARDGHECHSLAERFIDDWLYINNIPHVREPVYPSDSDVNPGGLLRADWGVGEIFIEYYGLAGLQTYDERVDRKRKLISSHKLQVIEIMPQDIERLNRKLGHLLQSSTEN